jgi:isocitrate dehydrogenase
MMLRYLGWTGAESLSAGWKRSARTVTYDFARLMENAIEVKCSEFGDAIIKHMR